MIDAGFNHNAKETKEPGNSRVDPAHRSNPTDAIGNYLRDIGRYPRLTIEEERCLARQIRDCRIKFRHSMLSDENVLRQSAKLLIEVGDGSRRADRVLDVGVSQLEQKRRLKQIAVINGKTLVGMFSAGHSHWTSARAARGIRLVDETHLKTREIESIWRSMSNRSGAPQRHLSAYEELRNEMVSANLRLAVSVARKYRGRGLPFLDLVQEASAGLFRAIDKFDPDRGLKFSTYAVWWAKQAVRSALAEKGRIMRLNPTAIQRVRELQQRAIQLQQDYEKRIRLEDVAQSIGQPRAELLHYWRAQVGVTSLDQPIDMGSDETFSDSLVDPRPGDSLGPLIQADERSAIRKALRRLEPRERKVIRLRFGLKDGIYRNLAEVGRELSLTRERIRQIEKASLEKLQHTITDISSKIR